MRDSDPDNRSLWANPLTHEEVKQARLRNQAMNWGMAPTSYTCDSCHLVNKCRLAFDAYNTNGDCLLSK